MGGCCGKRKKKGKRGEEKAPSTTRSGRNQRPAPVSHNSADPGQPSSKTGSPLSFPVPTQGVESQHSDSTGSPPSFPDPPPPIPAPTPSPDKKRSKASNAESQAKPSLDHHPPLHKDASTPLVPDTEAEVDEDSSQHSHVSETNSGNWTSSQLTSTDVGNADGTETETETGNRTTEEGGETVTDTGNTETMGGSGGTETETGNTVGDTGMSETETERGKTSELESAEESGITTSATTTSAFSPSVQDSSTSPLQKMDDVKTDGDQEGHSAHSIPGEKDSHPTGTDDKRKEEQEQPSPIQTNLLEQPAIQPNQTLPLETVQDPSDIEPERLPSNEKDKANLEDASPAEQNEEKVEERSPPSHPTTSPPISPPLQPKEPEPTETVSQDGEEESLSSSSPLETTSGSSSSSETDGKETVPALVQQSQAEPMDPQLTAPPHHQSASTHSEDTSKGHSTKPASTDKVKPTRRTNKGGKKGGKDGEGGQKTRHKSGKEGKKAAPEKGRVSQSRDRSRSKGGRDKAGAGKERKGGKEKNKKGGKDGTSQRSNPKSPKPA